MDDHGDGAAEAVAAARQMAIIFLFAALLTFTALASGPVSSVWIVGVGFAHLVAGALSWFCPWHRWGLESTAALGLLAIILLSATTWVFGGYASGLGPMFVLVFAWLGLHHPLPVILAAVPAAAVGYAWALLAADVRPRLVASTLVLIPIAATVAVLISRTVRELRQTQRDLHVKDRWRAALMATLAHDVRSPLSSVVGVLEIIEDDPNTDPQYLPLISSATRQTSRVLRLAMGILEVERVEQGKLRLDLRHVHLAKIADEVAALTQAEDVEVEIPAGMVAWADGERLEQILYNLINNALRHGDPPVVISARQIDDAQIEIVIRDHGSGVPADDVANLFDRLSAADRSPQSVGLGLWIVNMLVEAHGGSVRYERADPGAQFVVNLPHDARVQTSALANAE